MNGKGYKSPQVAAAIAAVLAISASWSPGTYAKSRPSDAIIGTGYTDAIIGTGYTDAIIGTGYTDAIIGTGYTDAIIGTGYTDAIIGTGYTDAIIGTGYTDAIIGTGYTDKSQILLAGTIDAFDVKKNTVEVLGRTFALPTSSVVIEQLLAGRQLQVSVVGTLGADGTTKNTSLQVATTEYVAGVSQVIVSGRIKRTDSDIATFYIGKVAVDYSAIIMSQHPAEGDVVSVLGTQPQRGGVILATGISR
jgi:hypothetical protein